MSNVPANRTTPQHSPELKLLAGEHPAFDAKSQGPTFALAREFSRRLEADKSWAAAERWLLAELGARERVAAHVVRSPGGHLDEKDATAAGPTLGEVWAKYAAEKQHIEWFPKSERYIRLALERFRDRPLMELKQADWAAYIAEERAHTSKSSQRYEFRRFRTMIKWARQNSVIPPALHPWEFGRLTYDKRRRTVIDAASFEKMVAAASPIFRVYLLCARFGGGLRRREVLHLHRSWIDFETGIVQLPGEAMIDGKLEGVTKGRRPRTTFLEKRALDALKLLPRIPGDDRIFINHSRGGTSLYSLDWPTMEWSRLRKKLGIKGAPGEVARLHDTRGTAASDLLSRGGDLLSVCEAFGWSDMKTAERYRRSDERDVARLATLAKEARHGS